MKIIIGNHIEHSILKMSSDDRIFSHRAIWFAEDGDVIILPDEPNIDYLKYVTSLTGVNFESLQVFVPPNNRYNGKHFDPYSLTDDKFIDKLTFNFEKVKYIFPLWPSPAIARFAEKLNLEDRLIGIDFISQNGVELVNNKAYFRVFATTAGIPIARGEVCHVIEDAHIALKSLLKKKGAVMVKQAHNGAGVGNELVINDFNLDTNHVGARNLYRLSSEEKTIENYLNKRWDWASVQGKRPVVIEEYIPNSQTIYAEFFSDDSGVHNTGSGRLGYTNQRLVQEIAPLRGIPEKSLSQLLTYGKKLAYFYNQIGYRGYLSADALIDESGKVIFTEMNARVGGSLHIYDSIAKRVVKTSDYPERTVAQYHSPSHWDPVNFQAFISTIEKLGIKYDPVERKGVLLSLPIIPEVGKFASFCIVYENVDEEKNITTNLKVVSVPN
ncbi:MAG: hypothetical protein ABF649_05355 [Bacillus sp. (in: firmicutes)]